MNINDLINRNAKAKSISIKESEEEVYEWLNKVVFKTNKQWNSIDNPPKVFDNGKSRELRVILKDGLETNGWYSPICGFSSSSSFYAEHMISFDVVFWRYKD